MVLEQSAQCVRREIVGHIDGQRDIVGDIGATHGVFRPHVATEDECRIFSVLKGVTDVVFGDVINGIEILEPDKVVVFEVCQAFLQVRPNLERTCFLERRKQSTNHEVLARTGASVQIKGLVIDGGEESQLESVLPFREFLAKSLHQVLDTGGESHDFFLLL